MLNYIAKTILFLSVSGSIITLVLLLLKPFIQSRVSKKWYYYVWLIVIIRLVVPYSLPSNIISDMINTKTDYAVVNKNNIIVDSSLPNVINENIDFQSPWQIETPILKDIKTDFIEPIATPIQKYYSDYFQFMLPYLGLIWFSVALIALVKKLLNYYHLAYFVKSGSIPIDDDAILKVYADTCQLLGIKKKFPVFIHQNIHSPMLIGFFKPRIVLPEKQMGNVSQLKYIFMHELTHYKRLDICYKWFVQIVLCVHWFNPIVYFVCRQINIACELSCDEAVIKKLTYQEQRAYGDTLLSSLELLGSYSKSAVSLTLAENSKLMKERLRAIMKFHKKSKFTVCISALLTFVLCIGSAFTGVQAATTNNGKESVNSNITNSTAVTANDLHNIQPINTSIGARAYNAKWASATGIEADTYKKQLDEKIKWVEDLYNEKEERFMLNETISEKEITNTLGIQYMYEQSSVYRDMANLDTTFKLLPYDSSFSHTGSKKYFERSVFYIDQAAVMNLHISYELSEGKLGLYVISPEGKVAFASNPAGNFDSSVVLPLSNGLWSIVTVNESETGTIKGTQKIEATLAINEIKIDIPQIAPDGHKSYGPYNLKKGDIVSSDITWSNDGGLYFSIGKEFLNFRGFYSNYSNDGEYMKKDITVQEDGLYYIFVGNPSTSELEVKNVVGTITINNAAKVIKQNDAVAVNQNTKISVEIPSVSGNGFVKSYGKYYLSKDNNVYTDITWNGSGYVMLLYTKENLSTDDIAALIDKGVLPLGGGGKFLGAGTKITSNFSYRSQKKEIIYNFTTSADGICNTMDVPSEGDYYFYVIAKSGEEITDIQGDIIIGKKANNTNKTVEK